MTGGQQVTYRKATLKDLDALMDLWDGLMEYHLDFFPEIYQFRKGHEKKQQKWFSKNIRSKNSFVMLAEVGDTAVGFVMLFVEKFMPSIYIWKKSAVLSDLFVCEGYRGTGVAKKLYKSARAFAKRKGADFLQLRADSKNLRANKFYDKMGTFDYMITKMERLK